MTSIFYSPLYVADRQLLLSFHFRYPSPNRCEGEAFFYFSNSICTVNQSFNGSYDESVNIIQRICRTINGKRHHVTSRRCLKSIPLLLIPYGFLSINHIFALLSVLSLLCSSANYGLPRLLFYLDFIQQKSNNYRRNLKLKLG